VAIHSSPDLFLLVLVTIVLTPQVVTHMHNSMINLEGCFCMLKCFNLLWYFPVLAS